MSKKSLAILVIVITSLLIFVSIYHSNIIDLIVPKPDFEFSINPISISLGRYEDSSNQTIIKVKSVNEFSGNVTFMVTPGLGIVGGIRFTFNPSIINLKENREESILLTLEVTSIVASGNYYVDVKALSGKIQHEQRIKIIIV